MAAVTGLPGVGVEAADVVTVSVIDSTYTAGLLEKLRVGRALRHLLR